jgi:hypothetical protein
MEREEEGVSWDAEGLYLCALSGLRSLTLGIAPMRPCVC